MDSLPLPVSSLSKTNPLVFDWGEIRWLCNRDLFANAEQTLGWTRIMPGKGNPLHYHPNCEELLYVIKGCCKHRLGEDWISLETGQMILIPRGVLHQLIVEGDIPFECLISFSSPERETVFLETT